MKQRKIIVYFIVLLIASWSTLRAQNTWNQNTACPGWNNPVNFNNTIGGLGYSGQSGIVSNTRQCPNVLTSATGVNWTTNYTGSQMDTVRSYSDNDSCFQTSLLPNPDRLFLIIDDTVGTDSNTGNNLPFVPTHFNNMDDTTIPLEYRTHLTRSIRIGDACAGCNGDSSGAVSLTYTMRVTPSNALLYLYYAIVAESPNHGMQNDQNVIIRVMRKLPSGNWCQISDTLAYYITTTINVARCPCMAPITIQPQDMQGWHLHNNVVYKDWERVGINLSNYLYDSLQIQVMVTDCADNNHYAYAYVCGECRPLEIRLTRDSIGYLALSAPQFFLSYRWDVSEYGYFSFPWEIIYDYNYATWRTLSMDNPNGYCYQVQHDDFRITRRRVYGYSTSIDSIGDMQTFRCAMTSALDPSKPSVNFLYINVEIPPLQLSVTTNDSTYGSVTGSGTYAYPYNTNISAIPNYGYHFTQWNDSVTDNPRTIILTQDTTFTAFFAKNQYSVTGVANDSIRGFVSGSTMADYLDSVTLTATPYSGYRFMRWSDYHTENPRTVQVTQNKIYTAIFNYKQYSISLGVDTSIHGTVSGTGNYNYLSNRTISANPSYGYHFTQWSDGVTDNPRIITLTQDTTFIAYFDKNSYWVTVLSESEVMGDATGNDTVLYLDSVTISATSNYGYHFLRWNDYDTDNPRTVQVTQNKTYTAFFAYNQYAVTLNVDNVIHGNVSGAGSYNYLSERTISAIPNYGYHFTQWSDGDTNNPRIFTLTQDTAFTAMFEKNQYIVTLSVNDTTLGVVTGNGTYNYLDTVTLTATCVVEHHHFVQWSDGITDASRTVTVVCDTDYTALFAIDTHSVTIAINDDLMGSVNGMGNYPYGTQVTIEATANNGYHFAEWSDGSRDNPIVITLEGDTALTAIFTDDVVPQICMITVQDGRNMVIWNKELEVQAYNIYREGITAGEYEMVVSVPYDSLSAWVDTASRPRTRSYRYRMTATDIFSIESEPSEIHKTMHLYINQGLGNECNLVWSEYEGADYSTYIIYRGTDVNNIHQIDVMAAGGNTTYTDENPPAGEVYYQVGILLNTPCNPTKSSTIVLSNIAIKETVGIYETSDMDNNICIYSENGCIYVNRDGQTVNDFYVYDVVGREIYHARQENHTSILPEGVYLVKVGIYSACKVVVIR